MTTWVKVTLSIAGFFIGGMTATYQASPPGAEITMRLVVSWIMGGLAPVGGYLVGFFQLNPTLTRPEDGVRDVVLMRGDPPGL